MSAARATSATAAADPVSEFFAGLSQPGDIATFADESATIRFEVRRSEDGGIEHWLVSVLDGHVTVTRRNTAAHATVRLDRPHFEAIVTGRLNAQAALLRGLMTCEGNVAALMMFQRCLPGPPGSTGWAAPISSKTVMAQRRSA